MLQNISFPWRIYFFYFKICRPCWLCVCILIILNKEQRHFRKILVEQIQICWHFASSTFQSHSNWFCTTLLSSISTILINSKHIHNTNRNISEKIWQNKYTCLQSRFILKVERYWTLWTSKHIFHTLPSKYSTQRQMWKNLLFWWTLNSSSNDCNFLYSWHLIFGNNNILQLSGLTGVTK